MLIRAKSPLRLSFAGGGTDVSPYCDLYGGAVLNAAINLYSYCTLEAWDCAEIRFAALDRNEFYSSPLTSCFEFDGVLDLHKAVYNRVVKQYNKGEPLAINLVTYSDAPAGSGLGSSSTMVVTILKAYVEWLNLPLGEYEIAQLAYEIERIELGLAGGRQDQYASTFGGFNFIEFYENERIIVNPLRIKNWMINELECSLVLYYTGASRESAKIIAEQAKSVKDKDEKSLEATHQVKQDCFRMKEALLKADFIRMSDILNDSWVAKKKMAKGITNSDIDEILMIGINAGAYSGKVSGAGGGGFIMFMVDPIKKYSLAKVLNQLDGQVFNFHFSKYGTQAWTVKA